MIYTGAKVREIATGDVGTVLSRHETLPGSWWVRWESGECFGSELHIREDQIDIVFGDVSSDIAHCIKTLIDAGYIVTKA